MPPLLPEHAEEVPQLRQLQRDVVLPYGGGVEREGERRRLGLWVGVVDPLVPVVPLCGVLLGEGGEGEGNGVAAGKMAVWGGGRVERGERCHLVKKGHVGW